MFVTIIMIICIIICFSLIGFKFEYRIRTFDLHRGYAGPQKYTTYFDVVCTVTMGEESIFSLTLIFLGLKQETTNNRWNKTASTLTEGVKATQA